MSINVNGNQNQIDLRKLMQARQSGKTGAVDRTRNKDPRMTMNGSIFGNRAQMVSGQQNSVNQTTNDKGSVDNVANVNTSKAIGGLNNVSTANATEKTQNAQGQEQKGFDLSNIDFDNLGTLSLSELQTVQNDLKSMVDGDAPFFLVKPFEQKLNKVNAEVKRRHEEVGNKLSEDNLKAEEKSSDDLKSDAESGTKEAESGSKTAEKGTENMNKMSSDTEKLEKDVEKQQKKLVKDQKATNNFVNKNMKLIDKENKNISNLENKNNDINMQIDEANEKIENLSQSEEENSQGEIDTLKADIESMNNNITANSTKMKKSTIAIKKYNSASNKQVRRLTKNAKAYTRTMNVNQNQIQSNQQESNKTLEFATKFEQTSQKIATIGTVTKYTGKAMQAVPWLAAAGRITENVGIVTETAGNYGVCAANITKTAVFAAQGNIAGALMSTGSAILSGATAISNTKQLTTAIKNNGFKGLLKESVSKAAKDAAKDAGGKAAKFTMQDAMELGGALNSVGALFGAQQQQQQAVAGGAPQRTVIAQAQHSRRRKIA